MTRELTCMCENRFSVDLPLDVDLAADPRSEEDILTGCFMSARCPSCGSMVRPELPFRVRDARRGLDIYHVPSLERARYLAGMLEGVPKDVGRVVIGFPELQEKLTIANAGLDDRVVEIVKFHLMRRAEQDPLPGELAIRFVAREGGALVFEVHGLRKGEVGRVHVPQENAERVAEELPKNMKREPYRSFVQGPYVSCFSVTAADDDEAETP